MFLLSKPFYLPLIELLYIHMNTCIWIVAPSESGFNCVQFYRCAEGAHETIRWSRLSSSVVSLYSFLPMLD